MEIEKGIYRFNWSPAIVMAVVDFALIWGFVRAYMFLRGL
jgi:hypothetical protein